MQIDVVDKNSTKREIIFKMRQAGAPMRQIAGAVGISKERVRQILTRDLGSTRHAWLSTLQLCQLTGLPRNRIAALHRQGIISPAALWDAGQRHYLLWSQTTVEKIRDHYQTNRLCKICRKPLPKNRILFCSDICRTERHKYRYMTPEEKQRVLTNIRRYREKKRAEKSRAVAAMAAAPVPVPGW